MKKKLCNLLYLVLFCVMPIFANKTEVYLSYDHSQDYTKGHPHAIPTVTSDDDDVTIKCDSTLYNVDVVIKDQYGNVMHHSIQVIGPDGTAIYIQEDTNGEREKTTIELYYDRKHLSGYFDE